MNILALDLAIRSGFAHGEPGSKPVNGSYRFARADATHAQIAADAMAWAISLLREVKPSIVVYEQPLPPNFTRGHTNLNTALVLMGLPFLIGGIAYKLGIYDIRVARVSDVRCFFLGENMKSKTAKVLTLQRCERFGWEPVDDNAADACALWAFQCSIEAPETAHKLMPLFGGAQL